MFQALTSHSSAGNSRVPWRAPTATGRADRSTTAPGSGACRVARVLVGAGRFGWSCAVRLLRSGSSGCSSSRRLRAGPSSIRRNSRCWRSSVARSRRACSIRSARLRASSAIACGLPGIPDSRSRSIWLASARCPLGELAQLIHHRLLTRARHRQQAAQLVVELALLAGELCHALHRLGVARARLRAGHVLRVAQHLYRRGREDLRRFLGAIGRLLRAGRGTLEGLARLLHLLARLGHHRAEPRRDQRVLAGRVLEPALELVDPLLHRRLAAAPRRARPRPGAARATGAAPRSPASPLPGWMPRGCARPPAATRSTSPAVTPASAGPPAGAVAPPGSPAAGPAAAGPATSTRPPAASPAAPPGSCSPSAASGAAPRCRRAGPAAARAAPPTGAASRRRASSAALRRSRPRCRAAPARGWPIPAGRAGAAGRWR